MTIRYRVSTPMPGHTEVIGNCAFGNGTYVGEVEPGPLAYFRAAGYTVEELAEPVEVVEEGPAPLPAKSASKADWVAAAVARGMEESQAEKATKEQLIDLLNTPNDPPAPEENA